MTSSSRRLLGLLTLLGGGGALHLVAPEPYERIVPPALGNARFWVVASGVAELACAAALAVPASRRVGALASAVLFAAVFPANLYTVRVAGGLSSGRRRRLLQGIAVARLPLQLPMITAALAVARENS